MKSSLLILVGWVALAAAPSVSVAQDNRKEVAGLLKVAWGNQGVIESVVEEQVADVANQRELEQWLDKVSTRAKRVLKQLSDTFFPGCKTFDLPHAL